MGEILALKAVTGGDSLNGDILFIDIRVIFPFRDNIILR